MTTTVLDKREARLRGMFGAIAPHYDFLNHLLSLNVDRWWRHRTTRLVPQVVGIVLASGARLLGKFGSITISRVAKLTNEPWPSAKRMV